MEETKISKFQLVRPKNIHLVDKENDIRFKGFFSYRHLRMFGWLFMLVGQVALLLTTITGIDKTVDFSTAITVLNVIGSLTTPLFMIAVFSVVLVAKKGYKSLFILYGGLSVLIILFFLFIYFHFIGGLTWALAKGGVLEIRSKDLVSFFTEGYFAFNIFIDLLLCTLLSFFLNYRPKRFFQGKKIYIFRAMAALPILYEAASIVLKILSSLYVITLSPVFYPFLTTKPPMCFFIFIGMAFFTKDRERYFIKKGKTHADYDIFLESNVNRVQFSLYLIFMIVVAALVDIGICSGLTTWKANEFLSSQWIAENPALKQYVVAQSLELVISWGFGLTVPMLLIIPLIVFYDYRKTYENGLVDLAIPVVGVLLVAILHIEGGFQIACHYIANGIPKVEEEQQGSNLVLNTLLNAIHQFIPYRI